MALSARHWKCRNSRDASTGVMPVDSASCVASVWMRWRMARGVKAQHPRACTVCTSRSLAATREATEAPAAAANESDADTARAKSSVEGGCGMLSPSVLVADVSRPSVGGACKPSRSAEERDARRGGGGGSSSPSLLSNAPPAGPTSSSFRSASPIPVHTPASDSSPSLQYVYAESLPTEEASSARVVAGPGAVKGRSRAMGVVATGVAPPPASDRNGTDRLSMELGTTLLCRQDRKKGTLAKYVWAVEAV